MYYKYNIYHNSEWGKLSNGGRVEWGVVLYLGEESIPPPTSFTVLTWRTAKRPAKRGRDIDQKCSDSNYGSVSVSALYNVRMNKKP